MLGTTLLGETLESFVVLIGLCPTTTSPATVVEDGASLTPISADGALFCMIALDERMDARSNRPLFYSGTVSLC